MLPVSFDVQSDWWLEEHGLIMEKPSFPLPPGNTARPLGHSQSKSQSPKTNLGGPPGTTGPRPPPNFFWSLALALAQTFLKDNLRQSQLQIFVTDVFRWIATDLRNKCCTNLTPKSVSNDPNFESLKGC